MSEQWQSVIGYEGLYSVSNTGQIRNDQRQKLLSITTPTASRNHRYPTVMLSKNGKQRKYRVHNLVTAAFLGPRPQELETLHWDDNPTNNNIDNLRYGTSAENGIDMMRNRPYCKHRHKFTPTNIYIRPDTGQRQCLTCMKIRNDKRPRKTKSRRNRKTTLPQYLLRGDQ